MNGIHGGWDMGVGIGMTVFWLVVIALIFILAKQGINGFSGQSKAKPENPLDILKKRYASGEISKNEFECMKKDLEK